MGLVRLYANISLSSAEPKQVELPSTLGLPCQSIFLMMFMYTAPYFLLSRVRARLARLSINMQILIQCGGFLHFGVKEERNKLWLNTLKLVLITVILTVILCQNIFDNG